MAHIRHTSCKWCGLDIEGPYKGSEFEGIRKQKGVVWLDRGGNSRCNDGKHKHAPYSSSARNPAASLPSGRAILARVKKVGNKLVIQPVKRVAGPAVRRVVKRVRRAASRRNPRTPRPTGDLYAKRITPALFATHIQPRLRADQPQTWAAYKRTYPQVKTIVFNSNDRMIAIGDARGREIR